MKEETETVARSHEAEKEKHLSSINAMELELRSSCNEVSALREGLSQMRLEQSRTIEAMKNECDARGVNLSVRHRQIAFITSSLYFASFSTFSQVAETARDHMCALEALRTEHRSALEDALKSMSIDDEAAGGRIMSLQQEIESLKEDRENTASAFDAQIKSLKVEMSKEKVEV